MTVGLDSSVLLRLLVGRPANQTSAAVAFLDHARRQGLTAVVNDLVIAETYYAMQFHYRISKAEALAALRQMLSAGEVLATGAAGKVLGLPGLVSARPGFVDRLIHAAYTGRGEKMATFEKSAAKLGGVIVLR